MSDEKEKEIAFKDLFIPLTNKKVIIIFILFGLLVWFNSLFTPFV
jgi:hypothetical protein